MKKLMIVFGTRPEAIKMAPLCRSIKNNKEFELVICVTAQHREMLDQVLEIFNLEPDIDLNIMKDSKDLNEVTSNIILAMRDVLLDEKPDLVLVHGDTTTTFSTSLACFYQGIKVGHVEAGLRTYDLLAPFPEEFNRQITTKLSDLHFAPTKESKKNLISEGVSKDKIYITGNTVIDALFLTLEQIEINDDLLNKVSQDLNELLPFDWNKDKFILITGHRRENFGKGFEEITQALKELAKKHPEIHFVYPVHLNPNVQKPVKSVLQDLDNIHLIEPLYYEAFIFLLKHTYLVLTDSGGIQEEAPSLGKPVLVMRDKTERPEAIEAGTVILVGTSKETIIQKVEELLTNKDLYENMSKSHNPYGDGKASQRIIKSIKKWRV
tara:strand:+ start:708 stop:1847 length:1140 start_codon:yes stop_codon:yes gene_type:complete